jgi:penicillin-binding protein-related factor A (putative recombinase)
MSEKKFEELLAIFGKRAYFHKITDTKEVSGLNKARVKTKPQPADYIVCLDGEMFLAEVKESCNDTSFPFGNIRTTQLAHARMIIAAGGQYVFFILRTKTSTWYKVPAQVILGSSRSSIKWIELGGFRFARHLR